MKFIPIPFYVAFKQKPLVARNEIASTLILKKFYNNLDH